MMTNTLIPLLLFALSIFPDALVYANDKRMPPMAHFTFNGNAKNTGKERAEFELKNVAFNTDTLYLNGQYEFDSSEIGYRAVCKTPNFNYAAFTVALTFKAEEFTERKTNIFVGGTSHRWFEMKRGESGDLIITFNNHNLSYEVTNASLAAGKWTTVACGVDFSAHKILVYINRIKSAEFDLPKDFKLRVIGSTAEERDKNWSFTNYSNSNVFHGFVDELILYNRMLTDSELSEIPLTP